MNMYFTIVSGGKIEMNELKDFFLKDLVSGSKLKKEKHRRKGEYLFRSIPIRQIPEFEKDGWTVSNQRKVNARVKKQKPVDMAFEDQIWTLLADMGFTQMNSGRLFKLPYSEDLNLTQQVDCIAIGEEVILIVECKASESLDKKRSFKETIEAIGGKKEGIINTLRKVFPGSKYRIKFIFATKNYVLPSSDIERMKTFDIAYFQEEEIKYYLELAHHLGPAVQYQLLGNLFQGQKIPELENKIPALRGKLGGHTFYLFSIEPQKLLKIAYVLHRTEANKEMMPTYQRIIKKERLKAIDNFLTNGGFFPNSITISVDSDKPLQFDLSNTQCEDSVCRIGILSLPQRYRSAFIIDGQHRLYGYTKSKYKNINTVPVVAFENLDREKQVELFMQINENQKTVAKNLRNTLNADLLWDSSDLTQAIKAIKLRIAQELGENKRSPLYERVVIGENTKTPTTCVTIDTISAALDRSSFFGLVNKQSIQVPGTFYDGNVRTTFDRLNQYLMLCFDYVAEHLQDQWKLGNEGFIAINSTIYALILIINDICNHIVKNQSANPRLGLIDSFANETTIFLDPIIKYFHELSVEEQALFKQSYGIGGRTKSWRTLQRVIRDTKPDFKPEGLDEYLRDSLKLYNTKSFEIIREIETYLKADIKQKLQGEYGIRWWKKGVPFEVYDSAETLATRKNREIDDPTKEEEPYDQLHLIDYRKIILHNWSKLFQQNYSYPGENGDKNDKTAWLAKVNSIRNKNDHQYSVTEEEYEYLKEIINWILAPKHLI
jgi:DNA sulfur modification protein DndB